MKSKPILQRSRELVVVALFVAFMLSGTAAAEIIPSMISTEDMGDHLYGEVVSLLWIIIPIMIGVGAILIALGGANYKAKAAGYVIVSSCVIAMLVFFVLPWIITDMKAVAENGANTTSI